MWMTIDEIEEWEKKNKTVKVPEEKWLLAQETMRKYQKIQEVMDSRPDDDAKSNSKALSEIEVVMYGNNN